MGGRGGALRSEGGNGVMLGFVGLQEVGRRSRREVCSVGIEEEVVSATRGVCSRMCLERVWFRSAGGGRTCRVRSTLKKNLGIVLPLRSPEGRERPGEGWKECSWVEEGVGGRCESFGMGPCSGRYQR